MKLHSPQFLKQLRRGVKKTVRSSRELKREFRRVNKIHRRYSSALFTRIAVSIGFALGVWFIANATRHPATALAFINLWILAWAFIHAQNLLTCIFKATDLPALALLPVSNSTIFRWELQRFFWKAIISLLDLIAGFVALGLFLQLSAIQWLGLLPIIILSWATLIALAGLGAARLPRLPYPIIVSILIFFPVVLLFTRKLIGPSLLQLLDHCAPELNFLLPTGWPVSLFPLLLPNGNWLTLGFLTPVCILVWTIKSSFDRLQSKFHFAEYISPEPSDLIPNEERTVKLPQETPQHLGITAITEIIESRQFFAAPSSLTSGWFEKRLWGWLNQREKALFEFAFPNGVFISIPWKKIFRNFSLVIAATFAVGFISPPFKLWTLAPGLFIVICQVLVQILATGKTFRLMWCSGAIIPIYANFGIGFQETARLLFKCSLVQLPLLLALMFSGGVLVAYLCHLPVGGGGIFGLKAGCLLLAGRFIAIVLSFSSGTNDTARFRMSAIVLFFTVILFGLFFLLLGGASLFVPDPVISWILLMAAFVDAYGFFWIYGFFYHRSQFDLIKDPRK
jgi:hypothetical protein